MPRVALVTLGCKLNYAETSTIGKQFLDRGFQLVDPDGAADVFVVNTCSVTEKADRECRQVIRRALRRSRHAFVIVTGCYAQLAPEEVASIDGVDVVLGSREKFSLFDHCDAFEKREIPRVLVSEIGNAQAFLPAWSTEAGNRTRAFLKVQDGCDYTCSFCTIPRARGESRSQSVEACVAQARGLASRGYRELVLTGVNVGDYGRKNGSSLSVLLRELVRVDGIERIRISSIEPNLLSEDILSLVASEQKLCHHFHVPLQSGSDAVLRSMRRRYTTRMYASLLERIRERIPDCGIGVDVIVGFPGENEDRWRASYSFLREIPVSYLHVFTYSERPDTPAADFDGSVPAPVRNERNAMLRILSQKKRRAFSESFVGHTLPVLLESTVEDGYRLGFSHNYIRVAVSAEGTRENQLVDAGIVGVREEGCVGMLPAQQAVA